MSMATLTTGRTVNGQRVPSISIPGTNIVTTWENVTSGIAKAWLELNRKNRRMLNGLVESYAKDMLGECWQVTHEGIAFDLLGDLVDGQHRLGGIVKSGMPQWFLVTRGLDEKSIEFINRGKVRTLAHVLQIMGYDLSNRHVAIARQMFYGIVPARTGQNDSIIRQFIDLNREAIVFASSISKYAAPITGVIGRAYYHANAERLARFPEAMSDRIDSIDQKPGDKSARHLNRIAKLYSGSSTHQYTLYLKAQNALHAYLNQIDINKLYENNEDLFPLPADKIPKVQTLEEEKVA